MQYHKWKRWSILISSNGVKVSYLIFQPHSLHDCADKPDELDLFNNPQFYSISVLFLICLAAEKNDFSTTLTRFHLTPLANLSRCQAYVISKFTISFSHQNTQTTTTFSWEKSETSAVRISILPPPSQHRPRTSEEMDGTLEIDHDHVWRTQNLFYLQ